jgi:hypothetical protein
VSNAHKRRPGRAPRQRPITVSGNKTGPPDQEVITNLSSHELTSDQISILSKGLTFVPDRTEVDLTKVRADLGEWERRMRLREFFFEEHKQANVPDESERFKVKRESTFTPNKERDAWLDMYIEVVKNEIVASLIKSKSLNVSREENKAFHELLHNDKIVIRPADKVSGIVLVDKEDYINKLKS